MTADQGGLRSGQVAQAAGVNRQTLRYYERRGLLAEPDRTLGGHRLYPPQAVTVLRVIKAAQRLGFTLEEVADLLVAGRHRHGGPRDVGLQAQATAKLGEVEKRIEDSRSSGRACLRLSTPAATTWWRARSRPTVPCPLPRSPRMSQQSKEAALVSREGSNFTSR
jgi:MerR family mercuric resistance operon transcriptional regulator